MRNFLLGFLTLIMLTPSLACAMTYCPMPVKSEQKPCHQSGDTDERSSGPMLALDCMGIDLFQQDVSNDILPDIVDTVDYTWADLTTDYGFQQKNINAIRGPPNWAERPQNQPFIILTTQRFRI